MGEFITSLILHTGEGGGVRHFTNTTHGEGGGVRHFTNTTHGGRVGEFVTSLILHMGGGWGSSSLH